jgi:hypothetical protein
MADQHSALAARAAACASSLTHPRLPGMAWHGNCSEEVSKNALNRIRGVESQDRVDEELYHDFETEAARKVRRAGQAGAVPAGPGRAPPGAECRPRRALPPPPSCSGGWPRRPRIRRSWTNSPPR